MKILQITNTQPTADLHSPAWDQRNYTSRMKALDEFIDSVGGERIVLRTVLSSKKKASMISALGKVFWRIIAQKWDYIIFQYPNFPFYWHLSKESVILKSYIFFIVVRMLASIRRTKICIDYRDTVVGFSDDNTIGRVNTSSQRLLRLFEKTIFRLSDSVWFSSPGFKNLIMRQYGINPTRTRIVLNGNFRYEHALTSVDEEIIVSLPEGFKFFYAGGLEENFRGIGQMIQAFQAMQNKESLLILCGSGGEWIQDKYKDSRIKYLGKVSQITSSLIASNCDIGLLPQPKTQYYELGFPTKIALYLTGGLPILSTKTDTAEKFLANTGTGICCEATELYKHMDSLVSNPNLTNVLKARCIRIREEFYWDRIYTEYLFQSGDKSIKNEVYHEQVYEIAP